MNATTHPPTDIIWESLMDQVADLKEEVESLREEVHKVGLMAHDAPALALAVRDWLDWSDSPTGNMPDSTIALVSRTLKEGLVEALDRVER
jgi:hypothetical protein